MLPTISRNEDSFDDPMREGTSTDTDSHQKQNFARLSLDSGIGLGNESFNESQFNSTDHNFSFESCSSSFLNYTTTEADVSESPPTKWARIRTPPNRKADGTAINSNTTPSSMFSPPSIKAPTAWSASNMLKTPTSYRGPIRITTPSSFQKTRVKYTKTPLKLSNTENVTGYHIGRPDDLKRIDNTLTIRRIGTTHGSTSKRCLVPNNDESSDVGSTFDDVSRLDSEDGRSPRRPDFEGFNILNGDTPTKINIALEDDSPHTEFVLDYSSEISSHFVEPSTSRQEESRVDGKSIVNLLHPRGIREEVVEAKTSQEAIKCAAVVPKKLVEKPPINPPMPINQNKENIIQKKAVPSAEPIINEKKNNILEKDILKWKSMPFVSPNKELDVFSGRWIVISTGRTLAQQDLLSDARAFFKRKLPSDANSGQKKAETRRVPALARINLFKHRFSKK